MNYLLCAHIERYIKRNNDRTNERNQARMTIDQRVLSFARSMTHSTYTYC